jgi:membrane-associated phospholipid phosphatase
MASQPSTSLDAPTLFTPAPSTGPAAPARSTAPAGIEAKPAAPTRLSGRERYGQGGVLDRAAPGNRRIGMWAIVLGMVLTMAWDRAVYLRLAVSDAARLQVMKDSEWYLLLRNVGSLWTWVAVAAILVIVDAGRGVGRGTAWLRRGVFLLLASGGSGAAAEVLKLLFRRLRPDATGGWYQFRSPLDHAFSSSGLGLPSSHTAVAFGAAFGLSMLFPRATIVFIVAAVGCAVTRMIAGAHFFSDAYAGVLVAYAVAVVVYRLDRRNNPGNAIGQMTALV